MSGQCSLCLSCGAPFIPAGEDMVEYDRLGNISVFYLQKLVRTNLEMQASIKTPSFCAKPDSSHILHKNHHLPAVQFVADYVFNARDGVTYPFIRAPTGKRPGRRLAKWALPDDTRRLDMTPLLDLITSLSPDARQGEDFRHEILCCSNCNHTMTMNFWFRYHLCVFPSCALLVCCMYRL